MVDNVLCHFMIVIVDIRVVGSSCLLIVTKCILFLVPDDYFYGGKQELRHETGTLLEQTIPRQPNQNRLLTLIQQAIKWQTYRGQMPRIKRLWQDDDDDDPEEHNGKQKRKQ
jgi:hypothetical protein